MPMYNLIECSDNYSKTSGRLWQYYRDESNNNSINSESFKSKMKITRNTPSNRNTKDVEIMVPLKYLSNFWRTLAMLLNDCEVNLILTWSSACVITNSTGAGTFRIDETKLYVPVVTLSTQDNAKLVQQLKFGFKRTVDWNKYQKKISTEDKKKYLDSLINPIFQGVNRLFVLSFENENDRTSHSNYYHPKVERKDYNVKIDGGNFFDQPINNRIKTYENIIKIATGQGDGYTTGCLLDYPYFKENYKMIAIDLSKHQSLDNFTANLDRAGNKTFFIIDQAKKLFVLFTRNCKSILNISYNNLNLSNIK